MNTFKFVKYNKMCFHKVSYDTELKAARAATRNTKRNGVKFHHYLCPVCSMWHTTKRQQKEENKKGKQKPVCSSSGKIQYNTEEEAKRAEPSKNYFKCKFCDRWHTTTRIKQAERKIKPYD